MINIQNAFAEQKLTEVHLLVQIHDELVCYNSDVIWLTIKIYEVPLRHLHAAQVLIISDVILTLKANHPKPHAKCG
jgi:hypothetical protein